MTNINLTEKETAIMTVFGSLVDEDTAAAQMEAGPVYASADELSRFAEMEVKSVKSVTNSLIKKGLVIGAESTETGQPRYELTENGVTWAYDRRPNEEAPAEAPAVQQDDEAIVQQGVEALKEALAQEGATKCSALRAVAAAAGNTPRALFIKAAALVGINSGTAARQWQEGRADEAPKAANEDVKEAALAYLMTLAPDEAFAIVMEHLTVKAVKEIASRGE